jgi:hypothetical protein
MDRGSPKNDQVHDATTRARFGPLERAPLWPLVRVSVGTPEPLACARSNAPAATLAARKANSSGLSLVRDEGRGGERIREAPRRERIFRSD